MNSLTVTKRDSREVKKTDIYQEFVLWTAMPPVERLKLGVETQEQFVALYHIGINTPAAWKKRPDFQQRVKELRNEWAFGKTSEIIYGIYRAAVQGNPHSQKLWLQYFCDFNEKVGTPQQTGPVIAVGDVRHLIEALPEPLRTKHYMNLRELVDDATAARSADPENELWSGSPTH